MKRSRQNPEQMKRHFRVKLEDYLLAKLNQKSGYFLYGLNTSGEKMFSQRRYFLFTRGRYSKPYRMKKVIAKPSQIHDFPVEDMAWAGWKLMGSISK
jgi:hypothetical protein